MKAAIIGFLALAHVGQAQIPEYHTPSWGVPHSLRASVRPIDTVKVVPSLPWVSEYTPPAIYATWWKAIAQCEHLILPTELISAVHWIQVNSRTFRLGPMDFDQTFGFTDAAALTIYVAQGSVLDPYTVQHEMVHQLDFWQGIDQGEDYHPPDQFYNVCGLRRYHDAPTAAALRP